MEAENPKGTYLFCMLELLNGSHLEPDNVERIFRFLRPLKENEDMVWLRAMTIRQFGQAWNDGSELMVHADSWVGCNGNYKIFEVPELNLEYAVDYYDDNLCMYCKANREKAFLCIG